MKDKVTILDAQAIDRAISRIAHEIIERNKGVDNLAVIGIQTRGVPMAQRICDKIEHFEGKRPELGVLDITFYRDDLTLLSDHPTVNDTRVDFSIQGKTILLTDDVLFTGRTVRAAMDALMDIGRAKCIQLAVLIDRGHRELPIKADYVGKNVPTSLREAIAVRFSEVDNKDEVVLQDLD